VEVLSKGKNFGLWLSCNNTKSSPRLMYKFISALLFWASHSLAHVYCTRYCKSSREIQAFCNVDADVKRVVRRLSSANYRTIQYNGVSMKVLLKLWYRWWHALLQWISTRSWSDCWRWVRLWV
jgi:hypothetical protein